MISYNKTNNLFGWLSFIIAAITYLLTLEPTVSFWDCGEFIASAYKLEVGHPPGAPIWMLLARFFAIFAPDPSKVALMINALSGIISAFTILFLFWTITYIAKKIITKNDEVKLHETIAIMGSGLVGALAYTFSDTFWFSAVEAEVYASSSFFTAIVFWAILKWESVADQKYADRWIILIAYLMGLSIGVHLLNLLAIPAIVFIYYFKRFKISRNGIIASSIIGILLLVFIQYGIIQGLIKVASQFELLFVNTLGMSINSGLMIFIGTLAACIIAGIYTSSRSGHKKASGVLLTIVATLSGIPFLASNALLAIILIGGLGLGFYYFSQKNIAVINTIMVSLTVILIGYSSFALIMIRSSANPPMDENNPENVFSLLSYLNREQYGDRPLLSGQSFNSPTQGSEEGAPVYTQLDDKYVITDKKTQYKYDPDFTMLFPRMYSSQQNHKIGYKEWSNFKGKAVRTTNREGEPEVIYKPTFIENLTYFFRYQIGHMYLRYFMWNFAGRQNDIQSHGSTIKGNWISGIKWLDNARLGDQDTLPRYIKENKANNKYYLLPLILGLFGLLFVFQHKPRYFLSVLLFFFFTGLAIVVYLNQPPYQPRERDYAYAGSFYVFAIFIGFGVLVVYDFLKTNVKPIFGAITASVICLLAVPTVMAIENWDDHDRSGRYTVRDLAANYLNSCEQNAIIFTYGDNDTFPLWYAQEVEGIRTDVRVVNLSLLSTDWYINQMKRKAYGSEALPISLSYNQYIMGKRDITPVIPKTQKHIELPLAISFVASDNPETKLPGYPDMDFLPANLLRLPVDSALVIANGTVPTSKANEIVKEIDFKLTNRYLTKSQLIVLDILANNNWQRPVYFAVSIGDDNFMNLTDYFRFEGFAYRLVPIKTSNTNKEYGYIDNDQLYDKMMNKFKWGRMGADDVHIDYQNQRTFNIMSIKESFLRLANSLIKANRADSAKQVLDKAVALMPNSQVPMDYNTAALINGYYKIGKFTEANTLATELLNEMEDQLSFFFSVSGSFRNERQSALAAVQRVLLSAEEHKQNEIYTRGRDIFETYYSIHQQEQN